nr:butyrophilin subfamily 1 member A1-like [Misgurnus anguillicaudatus]XP_055033004.1 butyrophilin subfamily 1 member A1-like [Misgurnus anguillicaudatus]
MKFICLTLLIISGITADNFDVVGPVDPLIAIVGKDVILPCSLEPKISAVNMRVEWSRLDLKDVVHLYEDHEDKNTNQLQSYRGRTEVFKDELQKGNTSLKLSRVQISDEGAYKCFIDSRTWYDEKVANLRVEAIGSPPLITVDGFDVSGGLHLQCESKGWYPEPELVWLDSEGVTLTSETTDKQRETDGFRVKHMITVYNRHSKYHCRVKMRHHMMETEIITSSNMFHSWRTLMILIFVAVLISVVAGILVVFLMHKKIAFYQLLQNRKGITEFDITQWRKYEAVNVTLDPDSAHPDLIVSDGGKRVRVRGNIQPNEERDEDEEQNNKFDIRHCVLGSKIESNKFYYEVHVRGLPDWDVGVARESVNRKGWIDINPKNGYWTVGVRYGSIYQACGDPRVLTLSVKPQRIGVFVDYRKGRVSFYDVRAMYHIFSFSGQSFNEKLVPFFSLGFGRSDAPLTICDDFK